MKLRFNLRTIVDTFFIVSTLALTGFEYAFRDNNLIYALGLLAALVYLYRGYKIDRYSLAAVSILIVFSAVQVELLNQGYHLILTSTVRVVTYYMIARIIADNFTKLFIGTMSVISAVSLAFYFFIIISPEFYRLLIDIGSGIDRLGFEVDSEVFWTNPNVTLIMFNVPLNEDAIFRNSGPFWEPGLYSAFLNIAFALNTSIRRKLFSKSNLLLFITSVTTFSTTSFICLFVVVFYYFAVIDINIRNIYILLLVSFIAFYVYNTEFVGGKINIDIEKIDRSYSRFGAMVLHYEMIKQSPILGYGLTVDNAQAMMINAVQVSPNGISNLIRVYGIPISLLLYYLLFKTSVVLSGPRNKIGAVLLFFVFITVAFSQDVTTRHFYYVLYFMSLAQLYGSSNPMMTNRTKKLYMYRV